MRETGTGDNLLTVVLVAVWIATAFIILDAVIKQYPHPPTAGSKEPPVIHRSITPEAIKALENQLRRIGQ